MCCCCLTTAHNFSFLSFFWCHTNKRIRPEIPTDSGFYQTYLIFTLDFYIITEKAISLFFSLSTFLTMPSLLRRLPLLLGVVLVLFYLMCCGFAQAPGSGGSSCNSDQQCNSGQCGRNRICCGGGDWIGCGGDCVNTQMDDMHCGDCRSVCFLGTSCIAGRCV